MSFLWPVGRAEDRAVWLHRKATPSGQVEQRAVVTHASCHAGEVIGMLSDRNLLVSSEDLSALRNIQWQSQGNERPWVAQKATAQQCGKGHQRPDRPTLRLWSAAIGKATSALRMTIGLIEGKELAALLRGCASVLGAPSSKALLSSLEACVISGESSLP